MTNHVFIQHLYDLKMLMLNKRWKILFQLNGQNSSHALSLPQHCSHNYLIRICDIHINGPVKQRELLLCNIQGCSHLIVVSRLLHPPPGSMFSSMQSPPMEPQTSALKLRCKAPAAKQKPLLTKPHWQCSDTNHNESALVVSVSDITEGR